MFLLSAAFVLACLWPTEVLAACGELDRCDAEGDSSVLLQARLEKKASLASSASAGRAPLLWATSGGGWRSMMVAVGFANAFQSKAKLFSSGRLTNVAANSGGSWFLANFAYNQQFYEKVISSDLQSLGNFSVELMTAYQKVISPDAGLKAELGATAVKIVDQVLGKTSSHTDLFNSLVAVGGHKWLWRNLVQAMLDKTPGSLPRYFETTAASASERQGLKGPMLHFQSSQLTSAYVRSNKFPHFMESAYLMDGKKKLADEAGGLPTVPTQYIVSGSKVTPIETGWHYPRSTKYDYHALHVVTKPAFANGWTTSSKPLAPLPADPSIGYVAAASSAVIGMIGSPELGKESGIPSVVGSAPLLNGLTVCGGPLNDDDYCDLQYAKLADGGFNDNIAVAQSIAVMQDIYGKTPLKLVLTDAPLFPDTITLKALFDWNTSIAPGDFMTGVGYSFQPGVHVTSPQVFNTTWSSFNPGMHVTSPQVSKWRDVCGKFTECVDTFKVFRYIELETETVDNPAYGVVAGTPINLLVFQASSSKLTDLAFGQVDSYANLASAIAGSEASMVFNRWLAAHA